jgi:cytochrome b561
MSREIAVEPTNKVNDTIGESVHRRVGGGLITPSANSEMPGFAAPMQAIHWITVVLLLGAYSAAWMIDTSISGAETDWLVMLHRSFGVSILLATGLRLAIRQHARVPPPPADLPAIQRFAARANVGLLYIMLILQTVLGLIGSMLYGDRIVLYGRVVLPPALPADRVLAREIFQLHGVTALLLLALIALHVAAALYHQVVRKDEVMAGMLPGMPCRPRRAELAPRRLPDGGSRQP